MCLVGLVDIGCGRNWKNLVHVTGRAQDFLGVTCPIWITSDPQIYLPAMSMRSGIGLPKVRFSWSSAPPKFFQGLTRLQRLLQRDQCHRQILGFNKCILCGICWTVMSKMTPVTCCKCSPQIYLERLTKSSKSLSFKTALNFFFKASTSNGFSRADSLRKCVSAKAQSWFMYLWVLECFRETRALSFHMSSKKPRPSTSHQLLARPACQVCQHSQAMQVAGEAVGRRCTPAVMGLAPSGWDYSVILCVCLTRNRSQWSGCP